MSPPQPSSFPGLFRTGDIGVSAEWRDISYDWLPVLTKHGVAVYSYLRDTYDHQRNLRPFLINPVGPTKQKMQTLLGLETDFALVGPEFLLTTVGLVHVEVDYGPSTDPDRPNRTHVSYYTVGRLDHPVLDWPMLERVLNAVHVAVEPVSSNKSPAHRKAEAALRSLGNSGFLQHCDPADLFYEYGAWPSLLPTLIHDDRWVALYTHLHGAEAVVHYRKQARAWIAYAQRIAARLMDENRAIGDMLLAAQRRGPQGGGSPLDNGAGSGFGISPTLTPAAAHANPATKPIQLNQGGFVAGESLTSPKAPQLNQGGIATRTSGSLQQAILPDHPNVADESLHRDQLTSRCRWEKESFFHNFSSSSDTSISDNDIGLELWELPPVEQLIRDDELTTTRQDHAFWCEINYTLTGSNERYAHTAGEKKAAERRFKHQHIPVGVILAALRAVMTLPPPQRPTSFAAAMKMDVFHGCVQRALAVLPARITPGDPQLNPRDWTAFLQAYRALGMTQSLRDVSQPDYHVLKGLFERQPDECWEVLSRIMHASECPADLSPRYLQRAIINNQREAAQFALLPTSQTAACRGDEQTHDAPPAAGVLNVGSDDPRRRLLEQAGLKATLLQPQWSEEYIRAWLEEAAVRHRTIKHREGWLVWGLKSGWMPAEHPELPPVEVPRTTPDNPPSRTVDGIVRTGEEQPNPYHEVDNVRGAVLARLSEQIGNAEYQQWFDVFEIFSVAVDPLDPNSVILYCNPCSRVNQGLSDEQVWHHIQTSYGDVLKHIAEQVLGYPARLEYVIARHHLPVGVEIGVDLPTHFEGMLPPSNLRSLWAAVLGDLQEMLPANEFMTWIKDTILVELEDGHAIVGTTNIFAREKLEGRYLQHITDTLKLMSNQDVQVQIVIGS